MFPPYQAMQEIASEQKISLEKAKALLDENFSKEEIESQPYLLLLAAIYLELRTGGYIQAARLNVGMQHD